MVKKSICYGLILALLLMNGCAGKSAEDTTDSCSKEESESVQEDIDGDVKGIIRLDGWNGASFEVTESSNDLLSVGAKFEFNFAL